MRTLRSLAGQTLEITCLKSGCNHRPLMRAEALQQVGVSLDDDLTIVGRRMRCQKCGGRGAWIDTPMPLTPTRWRCIIGE